MTDDIGKVQRALSLLVPAARVDPLLRQAVATVEAEVNRLSAEVAAFREAVASGVGPFCEDVCLVECIGVCGATP